MMILPPYLRQAVVLLVDILSMLIVGACLVMVTPALLLHRLSRWLGEP